MRSNNEKRRNAEVKRDQIKSNDIDKYALGMMQAIADESLKDGGRALALVLLRGDIKTKLDKQENLWFRASPDTKENLKNAVLNLLQSTESETLATQIADLASQMAETIYMIDQTGLWNELLVLANTLVTSENSSTLKVKVGLHVYNYLFGHLSNELAQYNDQFVDLFKQCLAHPDLQVASAALSAVSSFLSIAQTKFTTSYTPCLEGMVNVPLRALEADEEVVIEDAMVEFNNIAESEPKFFISSFKELFFAFTKLIEKNDYDNTGVRHQPLEFLVSITDRET